MGLSNFIYRQKQKIKYHLAGSETEKTIAEINRFEELIRVSTTHYFIKSLDLSLPKGIFDFVFTNFPLFVSNAINLKGVYSFNKDILYFQWDEYKVRIFSASEVYIINEIYVEKCYQFKLSSDDKGIVVFDIGMNVGLASLFFAKMESVAMVYGFEPFRPTFENALKNFELNTDFSQKIKPINFGLGAKVKTLEVPYSSINTGINSSVNANNRALDEKGVEQIQIKDVHTELNQLIERHSELQIVIKMDTEGAEHEIFDRLVKENIWTQVSLIMMEWHFESPEKIESYLKGQGFMVLSTVLNKNAGLIYAFRSN